MYDIFILYNCILLLLVTKRIEKIKLCVHEKNGCNYHNLTIIYNHFRCQHIVFR